MTKEKIIEILEYFKPDSGYCCRSTYEEMVNEKMNMRLDDIIEFIKREPDDEGAVNMVVKGYKVFDKNWKCRGGFQYEVGKTYRHDGEIKLCLAGFHFCENLIDCFDYYPFNKEMKVAEILAHGDIITNGKKYVTNIIDIVRELDWSEVLKIVNLGIDNDGCCNTGDDNVGDFNTGHENIGNRNSGDANTGHGNTGYCNTGHDNTGYNNTGNDNTGNINSGDANTGNGNTGNRNTGDWNTGDHNTGMWNYTSYSSGYFNTCESPLIVFNQPVNMTRNEFLNLPGVQIFELFYSKRTSTMAQDWYNSLSQIDKQAIKDIPNFNAEIFKQITGIDVEYSN